MTTTTPSPHEAKDAELLARVRGMRVQSRDEKTRNSAMLSLATWTELRGAFSSPPNEEDETRRQQSREDACATCANLFATDAHNRRKGGGGDTAASHDHLDFSIETGVMEEILRMLDQDSKIAVIALSNCARQSHSHCERLILKCGALRRVVDCLKRKKIAEKVVGNLLVELLQCETSGGALVRGATFEREIEEIVTATVDNPKLLFQILAENYDLESPKARDVLSLAISKLLAESPNGPSASVTLARDSPEDEEILVRFLHTIPKALWWYTSHNLEKKEEGETLAFPPAFFEALLARRYCHALSLIMARLREEGIPLSTLETALGSLNVEVFVEVVDSMNGAIGVNRDQTTVLPLALRRLHALTCLVHYCTGEERCRRALASAPTILPVLMTLVNTSLGFDLQATSAAVNLVRVFSLTGEPFVRSWRDSRLSFQYFLRLVEAKDDNARAIGACTMRHFVRAGGLLGGAGDLEATSRDDGIVTKVVESIMDAVEGQKLHPFAKVEFSRLLAALVAGYHERAKSGPQPPSALLNLQVCKLLCFLLSSSFAALHVEALMALQCMPPPLLKLFLGMKTSFQPPVAAPAAQNEVPSVERTGREILGDVIAFDEVKSKPSSDASGEEREAALMAATISDLILSKATTAG